MAKPAFYEDRTYHGFEDQDTRDSLIHVELAEFGPTQRKGVYVLRTMESSDEVGGNRFGWGYNGGGTSAAAQEILTDALGEPPTLELREDFCEDVLSQMTDEWRMRRGAILRWVRGWYAERQSSTLPAVVAKLPPVSQLEYGERPETIRKEQQRRIYKKR